MVRTGRMGVDATMRDADRARLTAAHVCEACGKPISQGELLIVRMVEFEDGRTRKRRNVAYHRNGSCYKIG